MSKTTPPSSPPHLVQLLPPTVGLHVRYADKSEGYLIVDSEKPIEQIRGITMVPQCREPTVTVGGLKHYRAQTVMVCDEEAVVAEYGEHPPRKKRVAHDRYSSAPPSPGSIIGFVSGFPFFYVGLAIPTLDLGAHVFKWRESLYVTLNTALHLIYNGGPERTALTTYTKMYMKSRLLAGDGTFSVQHVDAPFDTLLLVKLLGAESRKTRIITFVTLDHLEACIARTAGFTGANFVWSVKK